MTFDKIEVDIFGIYPSQAIEHVNILPKFWIQHPPVKSHPPPAWFSAYCAGSSDASNP
jgi:hypothetical protein